MVNYLLYKFKIEKNEFYIYIHAYHFFILLHRFKFSSGVIFLVSEALTLIFLVFQLHWYHFSKFLFDKFFALSSSLKIFLPHKNISLTVFFLKNLKNVVLLLWRPASQMTISDSHFLVPMGLCSLSHTESGLTHVIMDYDWNYIALLLRLFYVDIASWSLRTRSLWT